MPDKPAPRARSIGFTILVLALFYYLNPSEARHREKLHLVPAIPSGTALTTGQPDPEPFEYHDYFFWSTSSGARGKTKSIGVLGLVIVVK
jgi:hypothetical protein